MEIEQIYSNFIMKECQNVEWKENWNDGCLKCICAFANTDGGILYIGLNDAGKPVGIKNEKVLLVEIPNAIRYAFGIIADVYLLQAGENEYIRIDIPAWPHFVSFKGRFYYRTGSTSQELNGSALQRIMLKKQNTSWDSIPFLRWHQAELSEDALAYFRKKNTQHRESFRTDGWNEHSLGLLKRLQLYTQERFSRAAVLLFHPEPEKWFAGAVIRIGFFHSDTKMLFQDEITGPVLLQVLKSEQLLREKYLTLLDDGEAVPQEIVRETILNAVMHKDYSCEVPIQIKVFRDRFCIFNPGRLPDGWQTDDLFQEHEAFPFNPQIANVFFLTGDGGWGQGIQKIIAACQCANLPRPEYLYRHETGITLNVRLKR